MALKKVSVSEIENVAEEKAFGVELQQGTVAVRFGKRTLGIRRTLDDVQTKQAAAPFDADRRYLSARKRLVDTNHKAWRKVTHLMYGATQYWGLMTVAYPIKGIRLLNRNDVDEFEKRMGVFAADLDAACKELQEVYGSIREVARKGLGDLYNVHDYPESVVGEFGIEWDYPSVSPPEYLKQLNPALYQRECERVAKRFDEAVEMAEAMFATQLQDLVDRLIERLQPAEAGKKRVLKEALVDGFQDFIVRFKQLNIGSNAQLDSVVSTCEQLMAGVDVKALRKDGEKRNQMAEALSAVKATLDTLVVDQPERAFAFDE